MKRIIVFGVEAYPGSINDGYIKGYAVDVDWNIIMTWMCSNEYYIKWDFGVVAGSNGAIKPYAKEVYDEYYPEGYEVEYKGIFDSFEEAVEAINARYD